MTNEYDDLLAGQPKQDTNEYDATLQLYGDQQRTQLRSSLAGAVRTNPDQYAQAKQLSAQSGVPAEVVHRNLPEVQHAAQVNEYDSMLQASPTLQDHMRDPEFAKVAHDDLPGLAGVEQQVKDYPNLVPAQSSLKDRVVDWARSKFGLPPSSDVRDEGAAARAFIDIYAQDHNTTPEAMRDAFGGQSAEFEQAAGGFVDSFFAGLAPERVGDAHTASQRVAKGAGELGGFIAGAPLKVGQALFGNRFVVNATDSIVKALAKRAAEQSLVLGTASALTSTGTALDQVTIPDALKVVGSNFKSGAEMGAVFGVGGTLLPKNTIGQTLARIGGTTATLDALQGTNPLDDRPLDQKVFDYGVNALFSLHGAGETQGTWFRDAQRANAATSDAQTLQGLTEQAAASKLRARDPDSFEKFVNNAAADSPVQDVYIDAKQFAESLQQSGVDPAAVARTVPSVGEQLSEALQTGGDLRIPVGEYAARMAGEKYAPTLLQHLRTSPDAMSAAEAQTFEQSHADDFKAEAEKVLAQKTGGDPFQASGDRVEQHLTEQLNSANRFTPDVNKAYGKLVREFYATQGKRLGITPEEMFARYPLNVTADSIIGDRSLDQAGKIGDNFNYGDELKALEELARNTGDGDTARGGTGSTGGSGAERGSAPGTAAKVFRGSDVPLEAGHFTPEALGRASGNPSSGLGVFFTSDHTDAARYGRVSAHDVQLNNPKVIAAEDFPAFDSLAHAQQYAQELRAQGHDGIVMDASHLGGPKHYVVFDPSGVLSSDALYQDARGQITFAKDLSQPSVISLLKTADLSTFLHETGHFFLEVYSDIASREGAPDEIKSDTDTLLKWFGVKDLDTWRSMSLEQRRDAHEKFARGFESYLFEGKAPSTELQGLFNRFRSWLLTVYKSLTNLNVELTPEVRSVMDRMVASDDMIQSAEAARNYTPLFANREQAGMTEAEWRGYQEIGSDAYADARDEMQKRSLRDMRWASNARAKVIKDLQATAEDKRKATRAEVAEQVKAEPIYRAQRFLRSGEIIGDDGQPTKVEGANVRLNTDAVKELLPNGEIPNSLRGLTSPEGMHPDQAAEMFGFSSGDELIGRLLDLEPMKDVIDAKTDQTMLERYGDLTDPVAMARAADAAVHNEARSRFVATELRALARSLNAREKTPKGGSVNVLAKAAKEFATETIARKRVRDVRPTQFDAAETRAAKASEAATRKGDFNTAVMEKRNQLINGYGSRAAHEAIREIEKGVDYLSKFDSPGTRKGLDPDYTDQIDNLLERFDLRKSISLRDIDKRKSLADWITKQEDLGFTPDIDPQLRNEAFRQSYKDMTVEQFRGLIDAVRNIEHLGRLKKKLLTAQDEREFGAAVDLAESTIRANAKKTIPEELEHNSFSSRVKSGVKEFFAMHRKLASLIQQMDGYEEGGPLWDLLIRPLNKAGDFEAVRRADATRALTDLFKPIMKTGRLRQKQYIPAIGKSLSREGRLSIALNWGNETNRRRVIEGDKWTPDQANAILDTLTKEEWDFVQGVWDHINSYWPEVAAKERRITGNTPEKVEATPVQTKFGEYKGGYYPIKYDPVRSTRSESDSVAELVKQAMQGTYTRATTRRGHVQDRVESVERPMRKDLGVVFEHINQVVHDLAYHEYLIDANRLLRSPAIDGAIREHYGPEVLGVMRDAIKDVAAGDIPAQNAFERGMNYLRSGSTTAGLGWSIATSLLQPIGLTQSMVRIGPRWVGAGLGRWVGDAARMENTTTWIFDKSPMMKLRAQTFNRELNEIRNRVGSETGMLEPVKESYYYLIGKMQLIADIPTWLGQYEKIMQTTGDEGKAVALADQAVIDAQGHGQLKDLAKVQRGGPFMKLWTNFYSFFNTTLNLTADSYHKTDFKKPGDVGRFAVDMLLLYTIPSVLGTLVHAALKSDDQGLGEKIVRDQLNYLTGTLIGVRELGSAINGNDYSGPSALRFYATMSKLIKQVGEGKYTKATLEALNNVGGVLFHYPSGQVQRTVEGVAALSNGDTNNPGALISGPPAKH